MKAFRWNGALLILLSFLVFVHPAASAMVLLPTNAAWKYFATGAEPGGNWRHLNFNDSSWPWGFGQLGYGEGDETTVINSALPRPITVYFRSAVVIPSKVELTLRLLRDDGALVYLNGVEVRRDNLPPGLIHSQTLASMSVGGTDETTFFESTIPASLVVPGTNLIAVEVHQYSVNSGDLSFALELVANAEPPRPVVTVTTLDPEAREIPPWLDIPEDPAVFEIRRTSSTNSALAVAVRMSGTASNGLDYEFIPGIVTIPAGSATANVMVHATDDLLIEGTETVVLNIVPTPCPECYMIGNNFSATARILDNDESNAPPTVWISRPRGGETFTAGQNILLRAVAIDREDGYDITVEFFAGTNRVGTATFIPTLCPSVECPSWDFTWTNVPPGNFTLTSRATDRTGLTTVSAPVPIVVTRTNPPLPEETIVHVVALDPQAREPGILTVVESGQFAIRRSGNLATSIPVSFTLRGTASNGVDYAYVSNRVVIPAGATQALVNIVPLMDNLSEPTETVVLRLESPICIAIYPPPPECYLVSAPGEATVFISDRAVATNRPPTVQLNHPQPGQVFVAPATIPLQAYAQDAEDGYGSGTDGHLNSLTVEFFAGTNRIGTGVFVPTLCPAPYCPFFAFTWSNVPPGNYTLTARATDSAGATTVSAPVTITVLRSPENIPPGVRITRPTNGSVFIAHTNILIEAVTLDPDGYANTVEFFANTQKIGQAQVVFIQPPPPGQPIQFEFLWTNPPPGQYILQATTIDDAGARGTSAPVAITVQPSHTSDSDGDGVPNHEDECPNTSPGSVVDVHGCSIAQLVPCHFPWRNHAQYVGAVRRAAFTFFRAGLISRAELRETIRAAANSDCGRRRPRLSLSPQSANDFRVHGSRLLLEGDGAAACIVEFSTDLINWRPFSTNTLGGTTIEILDPDASSAPIRFYRLRPE